VLRWLNVKGKLSLANNDDYFGGVGMSKKAELVVKNININFFSKKEEDYISLTDIAKYKNSDDPRFAIQNWMKTRSTVEFMGIWEVIYNPDFNRVEFDTVKNQAGSNAFVLTPSKWIKL